MGVELVKLRDNVGQHLHGTLHGNTETDCAVIFMVDLVDFLLKIGIDGQDLLGGLNVFASGVGKGDSCLLYTSCFW